MRIKSSIAVLTAIVGGLTLSHADSTAMAPRTSAYAGVMVNAAADNSVLDFTKRPTLIGDQQYVVGSGSGTDIKNGAFSFKGMGFNWFGAVAASASPDSQPDIVQFGVANKMFGAGLKLGFAKDGSVSAQPNAVTTDAPESRTTYNMDQLGAFGNFRLSPTSDVYGSLGFITDYDGSLTDYYQKNTPGSEQNNSVIAGMAGWKLDATTEGTHSLNAELALAIGNKEDAAPGLDTGEFFAFGVTLYHGIILKQSPGFGVFAGSMTQFLYVSETFNNVDFGAMDFTFAPNVEFQKTLGKGFETFSGAEVRLIYDRQSSQATGSTEATSWQFWTTHADVGTGLRWNYENFAIEGKIADALLVNGPNVIGGMTPGLYGEVGVAVGF